MIQLSKLEDRPWTVLFLLCTVGAERQEIKTRLVAEGLER